MKKNGDRMAKIGAKAKYNRKVGGKITFDEFYLGVGDEIEKLVKKGFEDLIAGMAKTEHGIALFQVSRGSLKPEQDFDLISIELPLGLGVAEDPKWSFRLSEIVDSLEIEASYWAKPPTKQHRAQLVKLSDEMKRAQEVIAGILARSQ